VPSAVKGWLTLAAIVVSALSVAARAEGEAKHLDLAGRTVILAPPNGSCVLDPINPRESQFIDYAARLQAGRNKLVLTFADCAELQEFRDGKRDGFAHHGIVLVTLQEGEVRPVDMSRAELIESAARSIPSIDTGAMLAEIRDKMTAAGGQAVISDLKSLGVLDRNADALHVGLLIGGAVTQFAVTAITTLNDIPVSVTLYEPFDNSVDVTSLVAAQRFYLHDLVAMNAEYEGRQAWVGGIALQWVLIVAAVGVGLAALAALTWRLLRRRPNPPGH
jgi:hypothetical protein